MTEAFAANRRNLLLGAGLAALGVYMGAVTPDASAAAGRIGKQYLTSFGVAMFVSPLKWVFILAPLVMVFAISFGINRLKPATAQMLFWVFAALMGISLSSIFLVYTHTSIVRVFFITAASFGALSLYGYTTKRDLTGMGSFLMMGLIGIIIASLEERVGVRAPVSWPDDFRRERAAPHVLPCSLPVHPGAHRREADAAVLGHLFHQFPHLRVRRRHCAMVRLCEPPRRPIGALQDGEK